MQITLFDSAFDLHTASLNVIFEFPLNEFDKLIHISIFIVRT